MPTGGASRRAPYCALMLASGMAAAPPIAPLDRVAAYASMVRTALVDQGFKNAAVAHGATWTSTCGSWSATRPTGASSPAQALGGRETLWGELTARLREFGEAIRPGCQDHPRPKREQGRDPI
jgi:hypothetical protein